MVLAAKSREDDGLCGSYSSKPERTISSGLPTIHPESDLGLLTTPFLEPKRLAPLTAKF